MPLAHNRYTLQEQMARLEFGKRLKEATKQAGLTQIQLADAAGIPHGSISGYMNGDIKPNKKRIQAMADVLGVSVDYLVEGR